MLVRKSLFGDPRTAIANQHSKGTVAMAGESFGLVINAAELAMALPKSSIDPVRLGAISSQRNLK
jgi:hypothetical protein